MHHTILIPLDGSALAERAIPYAAWLGRAEGSRLLLLTAIPDQNDPALAGAAKSTLATIAEKLWAMGLIVETLVVPGDAARVIETAADHDDVGMIVMSTHGRSGPGRWLFGSVADLILRQVAVPVLLVPAEVAAPWPEDRPLRVLVPLDGSNLAEAVVDPILSLARIGAAEVLLLRVVEKLGSRYGWDLLGSRLGEARGYLDRVTQALRQDGINVSDRVVVGAPAPTIAATAREQDADLIAMATHGRGGLARLVMGSVTTGTLQRSNRPVLVVRPAALGEPLTQAIEEEACRARVPTAEVPLTLAQLDLVLRGLGELVYEPGHERPVAEAAWELLHQLKGVEAELFAQQPEPQADDGASEAARGVLMEGKAAASAPSREEAHALE